MADGEDGKRWIDEFLDYRGQFEFADAARPAMAAFEKLRKEHEKPADKLLAEARKLFNEGDRDGGYGKYAELVIKYYASSSYLRAKGWLANRR